MGAALVAAIAVAVGVYAYEKEKEPIEKRGSASEEFVTTDEPTARAAAGEPAPLADLRLRRRPPAHLPLRPPAALPPALEDRRPRHARVPADVGYGHVYVAQQKGLFFALDAKTGKVDWRKSLGRCAASSPTIGKGVVYQSYMHPVECLQDQAGRERLPGGVGRRHRPRALALQDRADRVVAAAQERPPLRRHLGPQRLRDQRGHRQARSGASRADDQVNTSAAYWKGRIFIASDGGTLYALSARTGRLLWSAQSQSKFGSREFWYATPTVAYGRVYIGNTDGTMYVFGAKSGKLLWARPLGTYIYGAAAVYNRRVFVGTYDGKFYALDAATGDTIWQIDAHGAVHAAPTVMNGLVYYAVCSSCGSAAARAVARGPDSTYAVRARDGKTVWRFRDGKYANPVVADDERIYITGQSHQYALDAGSVKAAAGGRAEGVAGASHEAPRSPLPSSATPGSSC